MGSRALTVALGALLLGGCVYSSPDPATGPEDPTPDALAEPSADPDVSPVPEEPTADASPEPTPTAAPERGWLVIENVEVALNVRAGPGTDNEVVTQAELGAVLATTGQQAEVDDDVWFEVVLDSETTGWVHGNFVAPTTEPTPTPLATPTPVATPTPAGSADELQVDAPAGLRLRESPGPDGEVIRTIPDGRVVRPTGATEQDADGVEWVEVRFRGDRGWVAAEFLRPVA